MDGGKRSGSLLLPSNGKRRQTADEAEWTTSVRYTVIPPVGEPLQVELGQHATVQSATEIIGKEYGYAPYLQQLMIEGREVPLLRDEVVWDVCKPETRDQPLQKLYLILRSVKQVDWSWEKDKKLQVVWKLGNNGTSIQAGINHYGYAWLNPYFEATGNQCIVLNVQVKLFDSSF